MAPAARKKKKWQTRVTSILTICSLPRACCMTIAFCCVLQVMFVSVFYCKHKLVFIQNNVAKGKYILNENSRPKVWVPLLESHHGLIHHTRFKQEEDTSNMSTAGIKEKIKNPGNSTEKITVRTMAFNLQFKKLYVLSKLGKIVDSNFAALPDLMLVSSAKSKSSNHDESQDKSSKEPHDAREEQFCASSGIDYEGMFSCSKLLPSTNNIFFVETSCAANQTPAGTSNVTTLPLSEKQACSIYSAAHNNPSRKVILLFTCPIPRSHNWTEMWNLLFALPNFFFSWVDLAELYANTSLSEFYHGPLQKSNYAVSHQSDLMRMFVLYLYGGTYMDLDIISFRSLDDLGKNFLVHEGRDYVVAGVFNVIPNHRFLGECLFQGVHNYEPSVWNSIGPALFTKTIKQLCNISKYLDPKEFMDLRSCNMRILPYDTFFSVPWKKWKDLYEHNYWPEIKNYIQRSYGSHYWNSRGNITLHIGSRQPLIKFAEEHCPPVYSKSGLTLS